MAENATDTTSPAGELAHLLAHVPRRGDLAADQALAIDLDELAAVLEAPGEGSPAVSVDDRLRLACVWLARGVETDKAKQLLEQIAIGDVDEDQRGLARFNLALVAHAEGDDGAARRGLEAATQHLASLALTPDGCTLTTVDARVGAQLHLTGTRGDETIAMQVCSLGRPVGAGEAERFRARVAAARAIEHEAIVAIHDGFVRGETLGVITAKVDGRPLADALGEPTSLADTARRLAPIADALAAAHAGSVVHGDLHPRQIVLTDDGARLRGFGLAPMVSATRPSAAHARRGYASPELADGAAPTPASDAYAFAAIVHHCLTGRAPLGCVAAPSSLAPELDARVDALLADGLSPDPDHRPSPVAFHEALAAIVASPEAAAPSAIVDADAGVPQTVLPAATSKLITPEDPDDLEGWIAILRQKPAHLPAREAVSRIEREARSDDRWDRVADAIAIRVELSQAEGEKIVLLRELAELCEEKLSAPGNALDAVLALIDTVSLNAQVPLVDELLRLAEITGRWGPVGERLVAVGKRLPRLDDQIRVLRHGAEAFADHVGDLDAAIDAYETALELDGENLELHHAMVTAYRKAGRTPELATALLTIAELETGEPRHDALLEATDLLGELGEAEGALEAAEAVREEAPDSDRALAASERWARELERWDVLAKVLPTKAERSLDDAEVSAARHEAAQILRTKQQDIAGAVAQYRLLIERDRNDRAAAEALVELLRPKIELGDEAISTATAREGLIDALSVLADVVDDVGKRAELLTEAAELLDREADGGERAADCRERIVASLPVDHGLVAAAITGLGQHYRATQNHRALADLLERRAKTTALDAGVRIAALRELRELAAGALDDPSVEQTALESLVELEPAEARWRDALIERLRDAGEDERAEALIHDRISEAERPEDRAAMLVTVARMREQAGNLDEAEARVREALELDEDASAAWELLRAILEQRERPLEALEAQVRAAQTTDDPREKVRGLFGAAKTWVEAVGKPERGLPLLRQVVELDPHHEQGTAMFTELLVERGDLEEAWPHAERWVAQLRAGDPDNREANAHAHALAGRCALAVHDKERARELLRVAKNADPRNREVGQALAELELESENWAAALKAYQGLALQMGQSGADGGSGPAQAELYLRMGQARRGLGETSKALQMIERALELDPGYADAARFLVEIADTPAKAIEARTRLLEVLGKELDALPEADERRAAKHDELLDMRLALATTLAEELNRPGEAVTHVQAVLDERPQDLALLHKALELYSDAELWRDAVAVLDRLAQLQSHGPIQAKYRYAGASLIRAHDLDPSGDEIRKRMLAVLDADPLHDKAFKAVVGDLERSGDGRELSKVLRARLKALPSDTEPAVRVDLLEKIASVYETKLGDKNTAMVAYEQAAELAASAGLDPDGQAARREKVIALSVQLGDDAIDKGIDQVQALIADKPLDYDLYHRLVELYLAAKQRDAAISVSRTLRFLKQADEAELELAAELGDKYQPPRGTIPRKAWREALLGDHPSMRLADLYGQLWPVMASREGKRYAAIGVKRSEREGVNLQASGVARWLAYMAQVIDMPAPDLFSRKGTSGGFVATALGDNTGVYPTLLAGDDALAKQPEAALAFRAGRAVARTHPHLLGAAVLPSISSLRNVIYGAVALTHPQVAIPKELRDPAKGWADAMGKMLPPSRRDDVGKAVARVIERGGADTKAYLRGCEHTAARAGFLMADSLDVAARVILQGGIGGTVEGRELIMGLVAFSVSRPYVELRRTLKLGR